MSRNLGLRHRSSRFLGRKREEPSLSSGQLVDDAAIVGAPRIGGPVERRSVPLTTTPE